MPGPLSSWFAADHDRLDWLLRRSVADLAAIDRAAFEEFRGGLEARQESKTAPSAPRTAASAVTGEPSATSQTEAPVRRALRDAIKDASPPGPRSRSPAQRRRARG